jgi:hypothetical protein
MDADSSDSADLVLVALSAPRSRPPPARPRRATRAGPPPVGLVRSTPERTTVAAPGGDGNFFSLTVQAWPGKLLGAGPDPGVVSELWQVIILLIYTCDSSFNEARNLLVPWIPSPSTHTQPGRS